MPDDIKLPPPKGSLEKGSKYVDQLVSLINDNKLEVLKTDLKQYDPSNLEEHYRVDLTDYQVELSHSKDPNTGADSFVILFTNIKNMTEDCQKIILAYINLEKTQYLKFKTAADSKLDRIKKEEEEKRFDEVMAPLNQALNNFTNPEPTTDDVVTPQTPTAIT